MAAPALSPELGSRPLSTWARLALYAGALAVGALAAWVSVWQPYKPGSNLGYYLGLVGSCMMLSLLIYPLRKRWSRLYNAGTLRAWFVVHIVFGILGPILVLFHTAFHLRSINASVAFWSMVAVAVSGVIGRFLYIYIYQGQGGRYLSLDDLEGLLSSSDKSFHPLDLAPHLRDALDSYRLQAFIKDATGWRQVRHFVAVSWRRQRLTERSNAELRRILQLHAKANGWSKEMLESELKSVGGLIDEYLRAIDMTARMAFWERLLAGWAVAHIPVVYILTVSAIVHVVAVHIY
jgi:hypothetical protein